jgi:hypothetical protein
VVLLVPFEISHWIGNENQDTISLLENYANVNKRGTQLLEAKGFVKSTR